jgi:hypothetical protein
MEVAARIAGARGWRSGRAVDLDHAVRAEDAERLRIFVALAEDAESSFSHLAVGAGTLEDGSASDAHRMLLLVGFKVGLG